VTCDRSAVFPGAPVSSTNKTDLRDKNTFRILLKLANYITRQKLKECIKNELLFDTDNTYVLFTKLIDISRSGLS
jgi:hypothetical protein